MIEDEQLPDEVRQSVEEAWPLFVDFLKKKDARVTQARKIVLTQVFSRHDHFCADDLAAAGVEQEALPLRDAPG